MWIPTHWNHLGFRVTWITRLPSRFTQFIAVSTLDITFFEWYPPLQTFGHMFWHFLWHQIWHPSWHSFWHLIWHSIWHVSVILSGFLCGILSGLLWCILLLYLTLLSGILSDILYLAYFSGQSLEVLLLPVSRATGWRTRETLAVWERPWLTTARSNNCKVKPLWWHQSQGKIPRKRKFAKKPAVQQQPSPGAPNVFFTSLLAACRNGTKPRQ